MDLTIVIPIKDEERRCPPTLQRVGQYLAEKMKSEKKFKAEVICVVNNTTDNSVEIVKKFQKKYRFFSYMNIPFYIGKGGAVALGFKKAKGDYIAMFDADGSATIKEVFKYYKKLKSDPKLDGVISNRYMKGSRIYRQPLKRTIFSRLFNFATRIGFGLNYSDTQCGYKVFTRQTANSFADKISSVGWTFDLNLLLLAKYFNYKIAEMPIRWTYKNESTLDAKKAILSVTKELIQLKKLELSFICQSFIERSAKSQKMDPVKSVLFVSKDDLWDNKYSRNILKKLSGSYDITVFGPRIQNRSDNQTIGNVDFIRRGNENNFMKWFAIYYIAFFKSSFRKFISWALRNSENGTVLGNIRILLRNRLTIEIVENKIFYNQQTFKLNTTNLKKIIELNDSKSILSEKVYQWNTRRFELKKV